MSRLLRVKEAKTFLDKPSENFEANVWTAPGRVTWQKTLWGAPGWGLMMAYHETSFHYIYYINGFFLESLLS